MTQTTIQNLVTKGEENFLQNCLALFSGQKTIFISDQKIWNNCHKFFPNDFLEKFSDNLILENPKADDENIKKISQIAQNNQAILALGSGTINDLCKIAAKNLNIPYAIIASAPSMNGYLSQNASITISGHKKTLPATLPKQVFCNAKILNSAPENMKKAGIGDAMCFYSCHFDWYLSHLVLATKFDERPFLMLQEKMAFLVNNYQKFSLNDEEFLEILLEILLISGLGMTIVGGSYPASQSEHLISHILEMKYGSKLTNNLHGQQIAITTIFTAQKQEELLNLKQAPQINADDFNLEKMQQFLNKEIALECQKEYAKKQFTAAQIADLNQNLQNNWPKFQKDLKRIYFPAAKITKIFDHFAINFNPQNLDILVEDFLECTKYAKFIRDRFTSLDFF